MHLIKTFLASVAVVAGLVAGAPRAEAYIENTFFPLTGGNEWTYSECGFGAGQGYKVTVDDVRVTASTGTMWFRLNGYNGGAHWVTQSASGRVSVTTSGAHDISIHTLSGTILVKLPWGVRPSARIRSMTGRPKNDFPAGEDCRIDLSTMSGKVEVVPA